MQSNLSVKRGFYMDVPIAGGRVNNQAALTSKGTLVFVVNKPSNVVCNPGGSSYFFQLSCRDRWCCSRTSGGDMYFDVGFALADALSSRPVLVTTSTGHARRFPPVRQDDPKPGGQRDGDPRRAVQARLQAGIELNRMGWAGDCGYRPDRLNTKIPAITSTVPAAIHA